MPDDTRAIVLPLQLLTHLTPGDELHFATEPQPFIVQAIDFQTGMVKLLRDWAGPTFSEWIRQRAGVSHGR
jgi:hypothetical protein